MMNGAYSWLQITVREGEKEEKQRKISEIHLRTVVTRPRASFGLQILQEIKLTLNSGWCSHYS